MLRCQGGCLKRSDLAAYSSLLKDTKLRESDMKDQRAFGYIPFGMLEELGSSSYILHIHCSSYTRQGYLVCNEYFDNYFEDIHEMFTGYLRVASPINYKNC